MSAGPWRPALAAGWTCDITAAERSLADAFRDVAERHPDRVALVDRRGAMTYAQVAERAEEVAAALPPGVLGAPPVLVLTGHDAHAVVAMLAVARTGGTYLALDARAPHAYRAAIVERHAASAIVTDRAHLPDARRLGAARPVVVLEDREGAEAGAPPRAALVDPAQPLAVSSTSGTSGRPKAVVHSHRNLVRNALRFGAAIGVTPDDRLLVSLPFPFVASGTPTFTALLAGATAVVHDLGAAGATDLMDVIGGQRVTVVFLTAGLVTGLAARPDRQSATSVRYAVTGGDRLTVEQVRAVHALFPAATLLHRYNTSETHWAAGLVIDPGGLPASGAVPIGWPVPWVDADVRDGELVVRGDDLALGYLDDPELTAQRFARTPRGREYRTGDLVTRGPDGMLDFVGRADATVKVRDVLVDPARVEAAIESLPGVRAAAVVPVRGPDGSTRLAGFVVAPGIRARDIRRGLAHLVPMAMVPSTIETMGDLPLTPMGKVDAEQLARAAEGVVHPDFVAPRSAVEQALADRFSTILVVEEVGRDDDFFALGADSLATAELITALEQDFGVEVELSALLEHPTPAELAAIVRDRPRPRSRDDSHLVKVTAGLADRGVVVLFSGASGALVEGMANLARHLDRRTCYVALPRAFEYRGRPDRSIAAMARSAARDVQRLAQVGPVEPLVLIGHSSGGNVAVETARLLRSVGVEVAVVVLLDAAAVTDELRQVRGLRASAGRAIAGGVAVRAESGSGTSLARKGFWVARLVGQRTLRRGRALLAGRALRKGGRRQRSFRDLVSVALMAGDQCAYDGDVLLLRAHDPDPEHPRSRDPALHWGRFVTGDLRVEVVPGQHEQLVDPPFVVTTAHAIEAALAGRADS